MSELWKSINRWVEKMRRGGLKPTVSWFQEMHRERSPRWLRREAELAHLRALPDIPYDRGRPTGVLLSDEIESYALNGRMIEPYDCKNLKPAAYELTVGELYSKGGKTGQLSAEATKNEIVIKPFEVAIIQTHERLNLPNFLIARWNVRVRWAYEGLLWVGGPQVDPGYKGYLDCPLYNLSDREVRIRYGDPIAVIDFVTTTPPTEHSIKYDPFTRTRILFEDYTPDLLRSALATLAAEKIQGVETELKELRASMSGTIAVIFTVIGIVVAALALFVSRQVPGVFSNFSPTLLVSAFAVAVSFMMWAHTVYRHIRYDKPRKFWMFLFEVIGISLLIIIAYELYRLCRVPGCFLY